MQLIWQKFDIDKYQTKINVNRAYTFCKNLFPKLHL